MGLLAPLYLLLAAAAAVPLLLHLMRRRTGARVEFPAVRYLERAEREHSRSLRLRNLLLMLLRVAIVLAIALAAARPVSRWLGGGRGATALAIVLDNSLSTRAVADGRPLADRLRAEALRLLDESGPDDRLWLVTADGRVIAGSTAVVRAAVERAATLDGAGDLPAAVRRAASAVEASGLEARQVVLLTDGQRSAWRGVTERGRTPLLVRTPEVGAPVNRSVELTEPRPWRWTPRGVLALRVRSSAGARDSVPYRVTLAAPGTAERVLARGTAPAGEETIVRSAPPERGWVRGTVELEPDELPADDVRHFALWVGPPPSVQLAAAASPFTRSALEVLAQGGRVSLGGGIFVGPAEALNARTALVTAPSSPVQLGAANRALERAGIPWRFGAPRADSLLARGAVEGVGLDGATVTLRYPLVAQPGARADTLARVGREPWAVASGRFVILASPLVPEATSLPLRAAFIPWLEEMLSARLGGEGGGIVHASPGQSLRRPAWADAIADAPAAPTATPLAGETMDAPARAGTYALRRDGRTFGMLVVNGEAAESVLDRWSAPELASELGGAARAADSSDRWAAAAFRAASARPLLVPILILVLMLILLEGAIAGAAPRRASA